jgi:insertion element IS1 protein InsB
VAWSVLWEQSRAAFQAVVDQTAHGQQYFSDCNPIYPALVYYPGKFSQSDGKSETYSVEGVNADLRHYLARLVRKSRCFSRCPHALECAIKLFVFCYNSRQLYNHKFPKYSRHLIDFVST